VSGLTKVFVPVMRSRLAVFLITLACACGAAIADDVARFEGRIVLEWLDEIPFVAAMRMVEPFAFTQQDGTVWVVPAGGVVDGRAIPPLFVSVMGLPFDGGFRKTAVVYDYAAKDQKQSWQDAQRMFFEGSITEGILPIEAKVMYTLLNATGSRWEVRDAGTCFSQCHTGNSELVWRPVFDDEPVIALVSWVRQDDPSLEEIEQRVSGVILHPGPHTFGYVRE